MIPLVAAMAAALILAGLMLGVAGLRRRPAAPPAPRRNAVASLAGSMSRWSRTTRVLLVAGVGGGVVIAILTGWVIALIVLPLAAVGLPVLLGSQGAGAEIERLEAMEEWTRSLAGVLTVGVGLEQALKASLRSTPAPIRAEVATLMARLGARWSTEDALRAFADDLDDATGDLVAANLLLGAQRRGAGLASVLEGLAQSVAEDVRARRAIEADRAKPRTTARWITIITIGFLVVLTFNGGYIRPYGTPVGQAILISLLGVYVGLLVWMRSMAKGRPMPRFIGQAVAQRSRA